MEEKGRQRARKGCRWKTESEKGRQRARQRARERDKPTRSGCSVMASSAHVWKTASKENAGTPSATSPAAVSGLVLLVAVGVDSSATEEAVSMPVELPVCCGCG